MDSLHTRRLRAGRGFGADPKTGPSCAGHGFRMRCRLPACQRAAGEYRVSADRRPVEDRSAAARLGIDARRVGGTRPPTRPDVRSIRHDIPKTWCRAGPIAAILVEGHSTPSPDNGSATAMMRIEAPVAKQPTNDCRTGTLARRDQDGQECPSYWWIRFPSMSNTAGSCAG